MGRPARAKRHSFQFCSAMNKPPTYCYCNGLDGEGTYIRCALCPEWYHAECLGIELTEAEWVARGLDDADPLFVCPEHCFRCIKKPELQSGAERLQLCERCRAEHQETFDRLVSYLCQHYCGDWYAASDGAQFGFEQTQRTAQSFFNAIKFKMPKKLAPEFLGLLDQRRDGRLPNTCSEADDPLLLGQAEQSMAAKLLPFLAEENDGMLYFRRNTLRRLQEAVVSSPDHMELG